MATFVLEQQKPYNSSRKAVATPLPQSNMESTAKKAHKYIPWAFIAIIAIVASVIYFLRASPKQAAPNRTVAASASPQALLIERKGLLEFDPENNAPSNSVPPQERKLGESVMNVLQIAGDGKDKTKVQAAIGAIAGIIHKYPDYSDAYVVRATYSLTAGDTDYQQIRSDLDNAIKYHSSGKYHSAYSSTAPIYSLLAKAAMLVKDYQGALTDLETAVNATDDPNEVFNNGGVKPEDNANASALQKSDLDKLVTTYPEDYRARMYRGLFYGTFTTYDERYYAPEIDNLNQAVQKNPKSALPHYFLGRVFQKMTFWTQTAARDISDITGVIGGYKDKTHEKALEHFEAAVKLEPAFAPGYAEVAEELLSLKRYSEAIPFYDKAIELNPKNPSAYSDRGLAKSSLASYYDATSDFSQAIELKKSQGGTFLENTYENRASAYEKAGNYDSAIEDYSRAIGLKFAQQVFLMSIAQIRAMYPELRDISEPDLLEGLRQKYFPNMSAADFSGQYQKNKEFSDFVLAGLYVSRGDVYLNAGRFREASNEYARALHTDPSYVMDRWKTISRGQGPEYFVDTQTLNFSPGNVVSLWVKVRKGKSQNYQQTNYEIDCSDRKIKAVSSMNYDSLGNARDLSTDREWQNIAPETIGEILYSGMCR
jgi:tetratricopeptide (TPR) repeat protein